MENLSFKQYLKSKEELREAIKRTPVQSIEYTIKRYCKLTIGENKETRDHVKLKPKQKIFVEWCYKNPDSTPTPTHVRFEGVRNIIETEEHPVMWNGQRLQNWLAKNTTEKDVI